LLHCTEQTSEVRAIELGTKSSNSRILALYRAPLETSTSLLRLSSTQKYVYNPKSEFLVCGDKNVDHLNDNYWKKTIKLMIIDKGAPVLFLTEQYALKAYWGSGGISPHILDFSTRWK
jgi:hypothetical protein